MFLNIIAAPLYPPSPQKSHSGLTHMVEIRHSIKDRIVYFIIILRWIAKINQCVNKNPVSYNYPQPVSYPTCKVLSYLLIPRVPRVHLY